jgi:hypothetical protein
MRVGRKISFNDYWNAPEFRDKRPVRNGSKKMLVGDNIYFYDAASMQWHQADSHHSNEDGSVNLHNLEHDTRVDAVLVSDRFYYFGDSAPIVPQDLLNALCYKNPRSYRVFELPGSVSRLIDWLQGNFADLANQVSSDPFDFDKSVARYSVATNRLSA